MSSRPRTKRRPTLKRVACLVVVTVRWKHAALRGRKLHSVMLELSSSEEVYLSGLDTLLNVYLLPISKAVRSSPPAGAGPIQQLLDDTILGLESILVVNKIFDSELQRIRSARGRPPVSELGEVMRRFAPAWKLYRSYHSLYDQVLSQLDDLVQANAEVKSITASVTGKPSVTNLLILPVQRLPRYQLFLQEILKIEDNTLIEEALETLKDTVLWLDVRLNAPATKSRAKSAPNALKGKRTSPPTDLKRPSMPTLSSSLTVSPAIAFSGKGGSRIRTAGERDQRVVSSDLERRAKRLSSVISVPLAIEPQRRRSKSAEDLQAASIIPASQSDVLHVQPARSLLDKVVEENNKLKVENQELREQLEYAENKLRHLKEKHDKKKLKKKAEKERKTIAASPSMPISPTKL